MSKNLYTPVKRTVRAMQFDGRNGHDIISWAQLPSGRLNFRSHQHRLDLRFTNSAGNRYDESQTLTLEPTDWLVIEDNAVYLLSDERFSESFEPKKSAGRPKKSSVDQTVEAIASYGR